MSEQPVSILAKHFQQQWPEGVDGVWTQPPGTAAPRLPPPRRGLTPVLPLVLAELRARIAQGAQEYGRPLETHNGRPALQDAYEEVLDLALYLRQYLEEQRTAIQAPRFALGDVVRYRPPHRGAVALGGEESPCDADGWHREPWRVVIRTVQDMEDSPRATVQYALIRARGVSPYSWAEARPVTPVNECDVAPWVEPHTHKEAL